MRRDAKRCEEMRRDAKRCEEMRRDAKRCEEMRRDAKRCEEGHALHMRFWWHRGAPWRAASAHSCFDHPQRQVWDGMLHILKIYWSTLPKNIFVSDMIFVSGSCLSGRDSHSTFAHLQKEFLTTILDSNIWFCHDRDANAKYVTGVLHLFLNNYLYSTGHNRRTWSTFAKKVDLPRQDKTWTPTPMNHVVNHVMPLRCLSDVSPNPFLLILNVPRILKTGVHLQFQKISDWPIWFWIDPL